MRPAKSDKIWLISFPVLTIFFNLCIEPFYCQGKSSVDLEVKNKKTAPWRLKTGELMMQNLIELIGKADMCQLKTTLSVFVA